MRDVIDQILDDLVGRIFGSTPTKAAHVYDAHARQTLHLMQSTGYICQFVGLDIRFDLFHEDFLPMNYAVGSVCSMSTANHL